MRILLAFWLLLITALSLAPMKLKFELRTVGRWHDTGHWLAFFVATVLACWNVKSPYLKLFCGASLLAVGMILERLEQIGFHNLYEWRDVRTDFTGIAAGLLLVFLVQLIHTAGEKRTA